MTAYVLDTNVLIFLSAEPEVLPNRVRRALADHGNELTASVVSIYEVGNKHRLGKLATSPDALVRVSRAFGVSFLPLGDQVCLRASMLEWSHRDPWDRIIAAQALALGAPLVSSDRAFDAVPGLTRLW